MDLIIKFMDIEYAIPSPDTKYFPDDSDKYGAFSFYSRACMISNDMEKNTMESLYVFTNMWTKLSQEIKLNWLDLANAHNIVIGHEKDLICY